MHLLLLSVSEHGKHLFAVHHRARNRDSACCATHSQRLHNQKKARMAAHTWYVGLSSSSPTMPARSAPPRPASTFGNRMYLTASPSLAPPPALLTASDVQTSIHCIAEHPLLPVLTRKSYLCGCAGKQPHSTSRYNISDQERSALGMQSVGAHAAFAQPAELVAERRPTACVLRDRWYAGTSCCSAQKAETPPETIPPTPCRSQPATNQHIPPLQNTNTHHCVLTRRIDKQHRTCSHTNVRGSSPKLKGTLTSGSRLSRRK